MKTKKLLDPKWSLAKREFWSRGRLWTLAAGMLLAGGSVLTSCTDKYDLDERDPEGWDKSIYARLSERGNFTNTLRLIDDLGYHDVLAKTGSKTLFVADDAAFGRFYENNSWDVKSYEDLSNGQKKLLLYGNMIDNSIQLGNLANVQGNPPRIGECMRRFSSTSKFDSVTILKPEQMPDNIYWQRFREAGKPIVCFTDGTEVPQIQFIESFLSNNRITNDDYNFLFNNTVERKPMDASINGVQIDESNIRCANGFVHKASDVVVPLRNMADLLAVKPQVSIFNRLLERFCAPYPDKEGSDTRQYNYLYDTNVDTVYTKRFMAVKSQNGSKNARTPYGKGNRGDDELLKFDPEWNAYYAASYKLADEGFASEQRDMAVIMAPSDEAMTEYFEKGAGLVLKQNYGDWDNVPDNVILKLINNNMLASFVASVPSKFNTILNDANNTMGVEKSAIDSVWLACNGAIYLTNKVYTPTSYVSVYFPAFVNQTMKIIDWGIQHNTYYVYLNALGTRFSFFIPTNNSLLEYIDPASYGKSKLQLLSFRYDETKDDNDRVWAEVYNYDPVTGDREFVEEVYGEYRMKTILREILDTHIVLGNVEDGNTYYRTKGGMEVRVNNPSAGAGGMTVEGSYQVNEGDPRPVTFVYDQTPEAVGGNGKCYVLEGQPILGTRKTVSDVLGEHEEFSEFLALLEGSGLLQELELGNPDDPDDDHACGGQNISLFSNYHYTIYVPTNASIKALQTEGKLSSWTKIASDYAATNDQATKTADSLKIVNFLKYHIQDNALFIGATPEQGDYETSLIKMSKGSARFYKVTASLTATGIVVKDEVDKKNGTEHHVLTTDPTLYNLQAREYVYDSADPLRATTLNASSAAVIHLIDRPLQYETEN